MANEDLTIAIEAINNASKVLDQAKAEFESFSNSAQKSVDKVGEKFKKVGEKMSKVGKRLSIGVTLPIVAAGGAAIKMASDMEETMNKVDVVFKDSAKNIDTWGDTTLKQFGIAKQTSMDMAALFGDMATSMGINTGAAADMSTELVGLAGDLASFKNIRIDVAQTALKGIFTGETESLKNLGIVMTQANLEAFALSQGINKSVQEMTEAEKVNLRYAFVLEKTANAQGDFARTSDGAANQMRVFQENMKELGAQIGQVMLPVFNKIVTRVNELLQGFQKLSPETQKVIVVAAGIAAALGPVVFIFGQLSIAIGGVSKALTFLSANPAFAVIAAVVAIGSAIAVGIIKVKELDKSIEKLGKTMPEQAEKSKKAAENQVLAAQIAAQEIEQLEREIVEARKSGMNDVVIAKEQQLQTLLSAEISGVQDRMGVLQAELDAQFSLIESALGDLEKIDRREDRGLSSLFGKKKREEQRKGIKEDIQIAMDRKDELNRALDEIAAMGQEAQDKMNEALGGGGGGIGIGAITEGTDKVGEDLDKLKEKFEDTFDDAASSFKKSEEEFQATSERLTGEIDTLKASLTELEDSFELKNAGFDKSVAEKIVDQENLIKDLEDQLAEGRSEGGDTSGIQQRLSEEKAALESFNADSAGLEDEIAEVRRRASLTEFERFIEDIEAKREAEQAAFDTKKQQIEEEIAAKEDELARKKAIFMEEENAFNQLVDAFASGNRQMVDNADTTIEQMKKKYTELQGVLNQIRAITAPDEGPDRRSDAQVFALSGAQPPVSDSVFGATGGGTTGGASTSPSAVSGGSTSNTTVNINVSRIDSPERVDSVTSAVTRGLQLNKRFST